MDQIETERPKARSGKGPDDPRFYDPDWKAWEQPRRWPAIIVVLVLAVVVVTGLYLTLKRGNKTIKPIPQIPVLTVPLPGTGPGQPTPVVLSGTNRVVSGPINFNGGIQLFAIHCACKTYTSVVVLQGNSVVDTVINVQSGFTGTIPTSLAKGKYSVQVVGSEPWKVTITQPNASPTIAQPASQYMTVEQVLGPFSMSAATKVTIGSVDRKNHLVATLLNSAGKPALSLLNATAPIIKTTNVGSVPAGSYFIQVVTKGVTNVKVTS